MNNSALIEKITLYITKSTYSDGIMRWSAVNSDTKEDLYGERMTLGLYQNMISKIKNNVPPPEEFKSLICSDYWCGGIPYVSLAHYPDLNGKAVPGQVAELFVDGNQLKARGVLFQNKLGKAVWKSLKQDEMNTKSLEDNDRIRISIAFVDLQHKHGEDGQVFTRKSLKDVCPECVKGVGSKVYLDGYLVHLALTRKPVNPRTIMEPENIMARKSEIKTRKEDAESIVQDADLIAEIEAEAVTAKSDVIVEMSDAVVEESKKETPAEDAGETPETESAEEASKNAKKDAKKSKSFTEDEVGEIVQLALVEFSKKAKVEDKPMSDSNEMTQEEKDAQAEADMEQKMAKKKKMSMKSDVVEKSALDIATEELYTSVNSAVALQGATVEDRLASINPALQKLGTTITAVVRESMGQVAPVPVSDDQSLVLEALTSLTQTVQSLAQEMALLKEKSNVKTPESPATNRVPVPRSIVKPVVAQSQTQPVNPNSITNIIRRSVSADLPLV